jgi:hypothetical protein
MSPELEEIIAKLQLLKVGEKLTLISLQRSLAVTNRVNIYRWINENHLKGNFRINWDNDRAMIITRLPRNKISAQIKSSLRILSSEADSVIKEMLLQDGIEEAEDIARLSRTAGIITPEEYGILLTRYEEIMRDDNGELGDPATAGWIKELDKG